LNRSFEATRQSTVGIAYSIDPKCDGIVVVWDGAVSGDEQVEHMLRIAADPHWPPTRYSITDLRTVTAMTMPNEHVFDALVEGTEVRERFEPVIVASRDKTGDELSFSARSLGLRPKVFFSLDDACEHLGIRAAQVHATVRKLRNDLGTRT
jgi:hypothetical protein